MFKERSISNRILKFAKEYPVLSIVGPRQSGKTTLVKHLFKDYKYVSLENIDQREEAVNDPRSFLKKYSSKTIIDEAQRAPDLFSYIQQIVDENQECGQYILTGSQQFLLLEGLTQSLAGRIAIFYLYPFTLGELIGDDLEYDFTEIYQIKEKLFKSRRGIDPDGLIFSGFYPRIHDKKLESRKWIENYVSTYVERDIRQIINVSDLRLFETFIKVCASMTGQLVNYASISNSVGISQPTVKKWISLLETSGIIFLLKPHHKNFSKRVVKTPKLYFVDTGLCSFLLGIRNVDQLRLHPQYGSIFETFVISDIFRRFQHIAESPPLYFWRDRTGNELDLLIEDGETLCPIEIKSASTSSKSFRKNVNSWLNLKGNSQKEGIILYGGDEIFGTDDVTPIVPWYLV